MAIPVQQIRASVRSGVGPRGGRWYLSPETGKKEYGDTPLVNMRALSPTVKAALDHAPAGAKEQIRSTMADGAALPQGWVDPFASKTPGKTAAPAATADEPTSDASDEDEEDDKADGGEVAIQDVVKLSPDCAKSRAVALALDLIDDVHGLDAHSPIKMMMGQLPKGMGGEYTPDKGTVVLSQGDKWAEDTEDRQVQALATTWSTIHELGHAIDTTFLTERVQHSTVESGSSAGELSSLSEKELRAKGFTVDPDIKKAPIDEFGVALAGTQHPLVKDWWQAVENSQAVRDLFKMSEKGDVDGVYVLAPTELFARSYVQYIATKTKHPELAISLEAAREPNRVLTSMGFDYNPVHWKDEDFAPIAAAFDKMFKELKWAKKKK